MQWRKWVRMIVLPVAIGCACAHAEDARPDITPPRPLGNLSNAVDKCYAMHSRSGVVTGEVAVTVMVDTAGRATGATSPADTPERLAAAAQCVAITMQFAPAMQGDVPVAGKLTIDVGFPTPPAPNEDVQHAVEYCQPAIAPQLTRSNNFEGQLDLLVRVGKDGRVAETVLPDGVLPWMEEAAKCLASQLSFFPARLNLVAVESWTTVPVDFNLTRNPHERVRLDPPTVRSDQEEIVAAYRRCYPEGRTEELVIGYRITITNGGRVRKAEVVSSSGDEALDQAGRCILRNLLFIPARRNGASIESTLVWPIWVRPPG